MNEMIYKCILIILGVILICDWIYMYLINSFNAYILIASVIYVVLNTFRR